MVIRCFVSFYDIKERTVQWAGDPAKVLETTCKLEPIGKGVNYCTLSRIPGTVMGITVTTARRFLLLHHEASFKPSEKKALHLQTL